MVFAAREKQNVLWKQWKKNYTHNAVKCRVNRLKTLGGGGWDIHSLSASITVTLGFVTKQGTKLAEKLVPFMSQ